MSELDRAIELEKENQELNRNLTVTNQSWKELMHQNERYQEVLEYIREYANDCIKLDRYMSAHDIENEIKQALEDECQTCNGAGTVEVAEEFMYNGQPVEGITYFACDKCNGSGQS